MFNRVKAEDGHMRDTAHQPAPVFRAERVASVFNDN